MASSSPSDGSITRREALRRTACLVGGIVSAPVASSFLSGCNVPGGSTWSPSTLSAAQNEMVTLIAERIIPATDTPGAKAAQVNRFIDAMLTGSFLPEDRDRFMTGLEAVNTRCTSDYGAPFVDCSDDQQLALIGELDEETFGPGAEPDREAPSFFRMMKELTIVGYYTSEIGATQELKLNVVPGRYDGDVPFEEIGRTWAQ
jgi:hypothetical protein